MLQYKQGRIMNRCKWVNLKNEIYVNYHDNEWGIPEHRDDKLYENLLLEFFQAGLSWECILNKRDGFRMVYDNFDIDKIINYDEKKIEQLLNIPRIIRNKAKIKASIKNSVIFKQIQEEFGSFDKYIWGFTDYKTIYEEYTLRTTSPLSNQISNDLKKRGMTFVGSTTIYSYLQAIGIINAHGKECYLHN